MGCRQKDATHRAEPDLLQPVLLLHINLESLRVLLLKSLEEKERGDDNIQEMGTNIIIVDREVIRRGSRGNGLYMPR